MALAAVYCKRCPALKDRHNLQMININMFRLIADPLDYPGNITSSKRLSALIDFAGLLQISFKANC